MWRWSVERRVVYTCVDRVRPNKLSRFWLGARPKFLIGNRPRNVLLDDAALGAMGGEGNTDDEGLPLPAESLHARRSRKGRNHVS